MYSVGLDVGGTFLKAAVLKDGPLEVVRRPIPEFLDTSSHARELDPDGLMASINDLLDEVVGAEQCDRILITGQMAGLAFVDEHGSAMAPIMSWQDTRYSDVAAVEQEIPASELQRLGDGLRIGLPLVSLAAGAAPKGAFVTSLLGYVAGALSGERCSLLHATDAAAFGLLDVASCDWSDSALQVAHLSRDQLPEPVSSVSQVGRSPRYGAAVMTAVGDQQAALMGSGLDESELSMNVATGCQVSVISPVATSPVQLRPYFAGRYLQTVTHLPAGRLLRDAMCTDLGREPNDEEWQRAIAQDLDTNSATGRALETIADACVRAAQRLDGASSIVFSGGLAQRIPALRELITNQLKLPHSVFLGDDAALEGLRQLDRDQGSSPEST